MATHLDALKKRITLLAKCHGTLNEIHGPASMTVFTMSLPTETSVCRAVSFTIPRVEQILNDLLI